MLQLLHLEKVRLVKNRIWLLHLLDLFLGMRVLGKEIDLYMKKTRIKLYRKVNLHSRSSLIKIALGVCR